MARGRRGNLPEKPYQSPAIGIAEHPPKEMSFL